MKEFTPHNGEVTCLLYCNAAKILISASWDNTVMVHDEMEPDKGVVIKPVLRYRVGYSLLLNLILSQT